MRTFYVIKSLYSGNYISINDVWDYPNMCREFETEEDAILFANKELYESFSIEKIYNQNK